MQASSTANRYTPLISGAQEESFPEISSTVSDTFPSACDAWEKLQDDRPAQPVGFAASSGFETARKGGTCAPGTQETTRLRLRRYMPSMTAGSFPTCKEAIPFAIK